jgi:3-deoxy-D-manno-octulosonic acid (KDO) 8-phosphate synthase
MTVTVKVLIPPKQAEVAVTTQYTAVNCRAIVDKFTATNTTGATQTISVHLVQSGGAAGADNLIVDAKSIAADSSYTFPEIVGHSLESGGFIATSSSAVAMTIRASGREIT